MAKLIQFLVLGRFLAGDEEAWNFNVWYDRSLECRKLRRSQLECRWLLLLLLQRGLRNASRRFKKGLIGWIESGIGAAGNQGRIAGIHSCK